MNIPWAMHINLSHNKENLERFTTNIKFDEDMKKYSYDIDDILDQIKEMLEKYGPIEYHKSVDVKALERFMMKRLVEMDKIK